MAVLSESVDVLLIGLFPYFQIFGEKIFFKVDLYKKILTARLCYVWAIDISHFSFFYSKLFLWVRFVNIFVLSYMDLLFYPFNVIPVFTLI